MARIFIDTGVDAFDIQIEPNEDSSKLFIKLKTSDGIVYSGELLETNKEFLSPPEEIK